MPMTAVARAQRWLFTPVDARVTAGLRIALAVVLLVAHAAYATELTALFSSEAPLTRGMFRGELWWLAWYRQVPTESLLFLHTALALPAVAVLVGVGGRLPVAAALLVLLALTHSNPLAQGGGDRLLRMWTLCMLASPCTHAWSVDAWWARKRGAPLPPVVHGLSVRLVQIQLAWMYCITGLAKAGRHHWYSGDALYYALLAEHLQRFGGLLTPERLGQGLPLLLTRLGTWGTLVFEVGFPLGVFWRRTRWATLAVGVLFHATIALTMMIGIFSLVSLWGYLAWVLPARWPARTAPDNAACPG